MKIYFTDFFSEWKPFQIYTVKQNTLLMFKKFFRKPCRLWDNLGNYGSARQATDDNKCDSKKKMRFAYLIS